MSRGKSVFIDVLPETTAELLQPDCDRSAVIAATLSAISADYITVISRIEDSALRRQAQRVVLLHLLSLTVLGAQVVDKSKLEKPYQNLIGKTIALMHMVTPKVLGQVLNLDIKVPALGREHKEMFNGLLIAALKSLDEKTQVLAAGLLSKTDSSDYDMIDQENAVMMIEQVGQSKLTSVLASSMTAALSPRAPSRGADEAADDSDDDSSDAVNHYGGVVCVVQ